MFLRGVGPRGVWGQCGCVRSGFKRAVAAAIFLQDRRPESLRRMNALRRRHLCEERALPTSFVQFSERCFPLWAISSPDNGFVKKLN